MIDSSSITETTIFDMMLSDGTAIPVEVEFQYISDDPWAVRLSFHVGRDETIVWTVARTLLASGLHTSAGEGEVRIRPVEGDSKVVVALCSPSGQAEFVTDADQLGEFVDATYRVVSSTQAQAIVDAEFDSRRWLDVGDN
ncbi:SsgA family sporulation/cell division regulator [Sciscionella sediminilitoris]|uniref:SsgA family sporulation/cell division regulator n=1 Tax=Sciscionella sediminilitoris TaxID=1445613 RepID=UPI00056D3BB0|nr:SsgA family sporulation/cell division regulator [Sciscionella sp. SE31]